MRDHHSVGTASPSDELGRAGIRVELSWSPTASLREHAQLVLDQGVALQAWRRAILSDPYNLMGSRSGANACAYHGGFCVPSPQDPDLTVVASIDLSHADLGGRTTVEFLQTEDHLPHLSSPYLLAELAAMTQRLLSYHHHHHGMRLRLHQSLLHHEMHPRWSWLLL